MILAESLGIQAGEMVSFIGAGGKTTMLFHLAKELHQKGGRILVTTTTKIYKPTKPHVESLFLVKEADALIEASRNIFRPIGSEHQRFRASCENFQV